jgi:hypothetical protein
MIALADVSNVLQRVLRHLAEAIPVAWRHDPVFRGAAIGAGVTLAVLLLRIAGPHNPELELPPNTLRYVPGVGMQTMRGSPPPAQPPGEFPKIAPGHSLTNATIVPTPDTDRFGTFTPGKHP